MIKRFRLYFVVVLILLGFGALYLKKRFDKKVEDINYITIETSIDAIEGFTSKPCFREDEPIDFYIHSSESYKIEIYRISKNIENTGVSAELEGSPQDLTYDPKEGYDWEVSYTLQKNQLESGFYYMEMSSIESDKKGYLPFLISPIEAHEIMVFASTNTWQAYNEFGGGSYYRDTKLEKHKWWIENFMPDFAPTCYLPLNRPYSFIKEEIESLNKIEELGETDYTSHTLEGECKLIRFLEENGHDYGVLSDFDLMFNPQLAYESPLWIFNTHSEYWSQEMMGRLKQYVEQGGKVIFASGNNIFREVKYTPYHSLEVTNSQIDGEVITKLTGTAFSYQGYETEGDYMVQMPDHWVFDSLGVEMNEVFGVGASGYETDQITYWSDNIKTLAIGTNIQGPAYMTIREDSNGSWLFNTSSVLSTKALANDSVMKGIFTNLIENALKD